MRILRLLPLLGLFAVVSSACSGETESPVAPDTNTRPVAVARAVGSVTAGSPVALDGTGSLDGDGDPMTFRWTLAAPDGSGADLTNPTDPAPTFMADVEGEYVAVLTVHDGELYSEPDTATVVATAVLAAFEFPPVDLSKVAFIEPMGSMIGNHVTPIDHQYYYAQDFHQAQQLAIDVYSPAAGRITSMQHMGSFDGTMDDYRLVIGHTDAVSSTYIHVDRLSDKVAAFAPDSGQYVSVDIPVSAGEVIGDYNGAVDYNVVDEGVTLAGFVNPASYVAEPWKIHVPDPFDYFSDTVREQLLSLCLRTAVPAGGKIDHDIDGRLVGNWFREGTNGYAGPGHGDYWAGHLAVAHNSIDPGHVMISVGDFGGEPRQFGVLGNAPNPAEVGVEDGLVVYELVGYDFYDGEVRWDREHLVQGLEVRNDDQVRGVMLFQLIDSGHLKVEVFPGLSAAEVTGFTAGALIYVR